MVEQAYLYLDTMKLQKAKNVAECITETYETEVKLLKAEILLNEGNLDEAEKLLDSIEDKESLNTILDASYLYMDMGYPEKALSWLTLGIEEYKEEEDFLAAMADCYRSGDHDEQAIYIYNKLIDKNPYDPSYWTGLAKSHFNRQEFEKTIEACDFALAADENFGEAHLMKAHSFSTWRMNRKLSKSISWHSKAKVFLPNSPICLSDWPTLIWKTGNWAIKTTNGL